MNEPRNEDDPILDRAIASLRDEPVPALLPLTKARTVEAMKATAVRPTWLRIAAALLIGLATLSAILFVLRHGRHEMAKTPQSPKTPASPLVTPKGPEPLPAPPTPSHPAPEHVLASNVSITGHVFFHGSPPVRREIDLRGCPQCLEVTHGPIYDDSLVVNSEGRLENVVVSISGGLPIGERYLPPAAPVLLDQKGCTFRPHVVAAMVGQNVVVKNSDPLLHTVHSTDAEQTPAFNFAQPSAGERKLEPLQVVETFSIKCDLHPWMNAWMRIFSHPYFSVTRDDGRFEIRDLPPGTYRLKAWHERLGVRETEVTVKADGPAIVNFTFEAR